uniref:Uncharacterized protein n=1 Tax=Romanomermis culicivorax TaxID=13658 RepID=A0A915I969_ROMCU
MVCENTYNFWNVKATQENVRKNIKNNYHQHDRIPRTYRIGNSNLACIARIFQGEGSSDFSSTRSVGRAGKKPKNGHNRVYHTQYAS